MFEKELQSCMYTFNDKLHQRVHIIQNNTFKCFCNVSKLDVGSICCPTHVETIFHFSPGSLQQSRCTCLNRRRDDSFQVDVTDLFEIHNILYVAQTEKAKWG